MKKAISIVTLSLILGGVLSAFEAGGQEKGKRREREKAQKGESRRTRERELRRRQEKVETGESLQTRDLSKEEGRDDTNIETAGTTEYFNRIRQEVKELEAQVKNLEKKHGKDSREVKRAKTRLEDLKTALRVFSARGFGNVVDPAAEVDLEGEGRRLVIAGLELQVEALTKKIRRCEDESKKKELVAELRTVAQSMVAARKKHRDEMIERLERELKTLRDAAAKEMSVEQLVERAVGKTSAKEVRREEPRKERK